MADAASSGAGAGAGAGGVLDLDRWIETLRKGEHLPVAASASADRPTRG